MAKKSIAAHAEKQGENDQKPTTPEAIKFISDFPEFRFDLEVLDENGKKVFHTDANGNNKLPDVKKFAFIKVPPHKNADGKIDPRTAFCFFIADPAPEKHGPYFQRIVDKLTAYTKNPMYKMYTDEGHFHKRNPEAFRIAKEKVESEEKIDKLTQENAELKSRLGLKR
jgi:hypothetical protein